MSVIEEERKYRSDTEILFEIMSVIANSGELGIKKTHLMYKTNLNSKMLQKYLDVLLKNNVITEISKGKQKIIRFTGKGKAAYSSLRTLISLVKGGQYQQEIKTLNEKLMALISDGFEVKSETLVIGKTGSEYMPHAIIMKQGERYLVHYNFEKATLNMSVEVLQLVLMVVDTDSKGILIATDTSVQNMIPEKLKNDIKVVAMGPVDNLAKRVKDAIS